MRFFSFVSDARSRAAAVVSEKAFAIFSAIERDAVLQVHPDVNSDDLATALQAMWDELSEHEKSVCTIECFVYSSSDNQLCI